MIKIIEYPWLVYAVFIYLNALFSSHLYNKHRFERKRLRRLMKLEFRNSLTNHEYGVDLIFSKIFPYFIMLVVPILLTLCFDMSILNYVIWSIISVLFSVITVWRRLTPSTNSYFSFIDPKSVDFLAHVGDIHRDLVPYYVRLSIRDSLTGKYVFDSSDFEQINKLLGSDEERCTNLEPGLVLNITESDYELKEITTDFLNFFDDYSLIGPHVMNSGCRTPYNIQILVTAKKKVPQT